MPATLPDQARVELRNYAGRTGLPLGVLASRMGYARQTLMQFSSAHYPAGNGDVIAHSILDYIRAHPIERPNPPGKLYPTANVRLIDELLSLSMEGAVSLAYGPPGTQKTFVFRSRLAEAWRHSNDPDLVYVYAAAKMSPLHILKEIGRGLGASVYGDRYAVFTNMLYTLEQRRRPVTIIIDEAHHLGARIDSLEVLREIIDRASVGMILAGHDNLEDIFMAQRGGPLEQWFSRIDYHKRLPGLSSAEVERIVRGELGDVPEAGLRAVVESARVKDYREGSTYISARRVFKMTAQVQRSKRISTGALEAAAAMARSTDS
jgi:type II secretory pathway predicted ATPase ExeA